MRRSIILLSATLLFLVSCAQDYSDLYSYQVPPDLDDGLEVGDLGQLGADTLLMAEGIGRIEKGKFGEIHSLLIYRDGQLVLEEYFPGHQYQWDAPGYHGGWLNWNHRTLHSVMSVNKSITSACVGIAVDQGFINSIEQSIFDYLPEHQHFKSNGREAITIEHLLTMTPGFSWKEWGISYSSEKNPVIGIWFSDKDPISFILDTEIVHQPGTHFEYYGGSQVLLGEIIRHASGMDIDKFSENYLFEPLGVETADWAVRYDNGVIEAAGGLKLTPRAMLKIGVLFLNDGYWNGERVVSEEWVKKSALSYMDEKIDVPDTDGKDQGYAYSWWIPDLSINGEDIPAMSATGWGGQKIVVIPDMELVVVFTGGNYTRKTKLYTILERYILPAFAESAQLQLSGK